MIISASIFLSNTFINQVTFLRITIFTNQSGTKSDKLPIPILKHWQQKITKPIDLRLTK